MKRVRVILLFIIIVWAAVSLAMIVQNIYTGPERLVSSSPLQPFNTTYPTFPISTGYDILKIMEYMVFAWMILFVISLILYFRSTLKIIYRVLMSLFGIFIIFGLVYIISIFIAHLNTSTSSGVTGLNFSSQEIVGTLPIIIAMAVLIMLFIYVIARNFQVPGNEKNERINESISRMIRELKFGNDVRGSIMKAYYDLSNLLRTHGIIESDYLTPREFENLSIEKAHIDSGPFEILVRLFEEARYSSHEMNEMQREEAIYALEQIKKLLEAEK